MDKHSGILTKVVGDWTLGYAGDGGPATAAKMKYPRDIAFDTAGNLYIADLHYAIRKVHAATGTITTIAGNGTQGTWKNGDTAQSAQLGLLAGICVDRMGNVCFADGSNRRIGKLKSLDGILTNYCGTGLAAQPVGNGGLATSAVTLASIKTRLDRQENMYLSDGYVRRIDNFTGIIDSVAGIWSGGYSGDDGPALAAQLNGPVCAFPDRVNNLFIADRLNYRIRKVTGILEVGEVVIEYDLKLFPNPSNGMFTLASSKLISKIEMRNYLGQLMQKSLPRANKVQVDLTSQPSGLYLISVFGDSWTITQKIIVFFINISLMKYRL